MTDPRSDAADIAWLRELAAEGATAPMRGGSILTAAGLIYGASSLAHWAVLAQVFPTDAGAFRFIWLGATGLFLAVLTVIIVLRARSTGVRTSLDRATRAVWSSVGWGIFALFGSIALISMRLGDRAAILLALAPSVVMVFYGLGWAVSAAMTRMRLMAVLAVLSFLAAPGLALLSGEPAQYLAYGLCLFVLMAVPGVLLMRASKQA